MRLLSPDEIRHALVHGASEAQQPRSRIGIGEASGMIEGAVFEAAVAADIGGNTRYLLFLTHDIPFEESLSITLADARLNVIDSARLGWMYSTGAFADPVPREPASVDFRFFDEAIWTATILDRPVVHLPLVSEPSGVHRGLAFKRHFTLSSRPVA